MKSQDEEWVDQTGRIWKIGEMEEKHVRNALRMVVRTVREYGFFPADANPTGSWEEF